MELQPWLLFPTLSVGMKLDLPRPEQVLFSRRQSLDLSSGSVSR